MRSLEECRLLEQKLMYMVVGKTGAGKSTTINYLARYPLELGEGGVAVPADPNIPEPCHTADSPTSVTTYPAAINVDGYLLCDCPGFDDTRGREIRVAISITTEAAVKRAKAVNGLLVVIDAPSLQAARGAGLKEVALTLGSLLRGQDIQNFGKSIVFVISKADTRVFSHKYLMRKIDEFIVAQEKRKSELNSTLSAVLNKASSFLQGRNSDAQSEAGTRELENECVDIERGLSILRLMQNNPQNIIIPDIFDKGESRVKIFEQLKKLIPIEQGFFDFSQADAVRKKFTDHVQDKLVVTMRELSAAMELPERIRKEKMEIEAVHKQLADHQAQRVHLDTPEGAKALTEDDPVIVKNRGLVAENKAKAARLRDEIKVKEQKIERIKQDLYALDTSEEKTFYRDDFKLHRGDKVGECLGGVAGGLGEMVDEAKGVFETSAAGAFALVAAVPGMLLEEYLAHLLA